MLLSLVCSEDRERLRRMLYGSVPSHNCYRKVVNDLAKLLGMSSKALTLWKYCALFRIYDGTPEAVISSCLFRK